jgi:hypothetical protein
MIACETDNNKVNEQIATDIDYNVGRVVRKK